MSVQISSVFKQARFFILVQMLFLTLICVICTRRRIYLSDFLKAKIWHPIFYKLDRINNLVLTYNVQSSKMEKKELKYARLNADTDFLKMHSKFPSAYQSRYISDGRRQIRLQYIKTYCLK